LFNETAKATIRKYGVGSCGPRGFYGTVDVHLDLEDFIAKMLNMEEAIIYSYSFSTVSSVIPAYAKRGDVIFVDEGVNFAMQQGIIASRSTVCKFKHNDMEDLERLLKLQDTTDKKDPKKASVTRRFLVAEGLYYNYGDIAPLNRLVELKYQYKARLFLDESYSFGTLGSHGRGLTEMLGVSTDDVDIIMGSLETSLGSIGGFAAGRSYVIDHQRLSGLGYCFSASLPPYLATVARQCLASMITNTEPLDKLHNNVRVLRTALKKVPNMKVCGDDVSPIIHLRMNDVTAKHYGSAEAQDAALQAVSDYVLELGLAVTVAKYFCSEEDMPPPPSLRITVMAGHTSTELEEAVTILSTAIKTKL
jgi:serine palmitoyltransferase